MMKATTQQIANRLRTWARDEIKRYGDETAAGGEPPFPRGAYDVLELIDEVELADAALQSRRRAVEAQEAYYYRHLTICAKGQGFDGIAHALGELARLRAAAHPDAQAIRNAALEAIKANHEHHKTYDAYGGYPESALCEQNLAAIAAIAALEALQSAPAQPVERPDTVAFPERDPAKPAEQQGIFRKFDVRRVDGSDAPGRKHHGCRYFVLDMDHDAHAPASLRAYADSCAESHPQLAADLRAEFGTTTIAANQPQQSSATDEMLDMLGRIHPYAMESKEDRIDHAEERLRRAYCIQQPAPVPDQACIVWRADLMRVMNDLTHKRAYFDYHTKDANQPHRWNAQEPVAWLSEQWHPTPNGGQWIAVATTSDPTVWDGFRNAQPLYAAATQSDAQQSREKDCG